MTLAADWDVKPQTKQANKVIRGYCFKASNVSIGAESVNTVEYKVSAYLDKISHLVVLCLLCPIFVMLNGLLKFYLHIFGVKYFYKILLHAFITKHI